MARPIGLNKSLGAAIGAIAFGVFAAAVVALLAIRWLNIESEARVHAHSVRLALDSFEIGMLNQETGLRGYILTGQDANLAPYRSGAAAVEEAAGTLRTLLADQPDQLAAFGAAQTTAESWQRTLAHPALALANNPETRNRALELEASGAGMQLFDQLRARLAEVQQAERNRLQVADVNVPHARLITVLATVAGALVTILLCIGIGIATNRAISRPLLRLADAMRRLAAHDLAAEVPSTERRDEIGEMARAVQVFKAGLVEVKRTSLLRGITDSIPSLIGYIDRNRRIRFLNGAFAEWFDLGGADVTDITDHPVESVFAATPLPGFPDQFEPALAGYPSRVDRRLAPPDGERRDLEVLYHPHRIADGTILGAVVLISDISQRKELDRRLIDQARELRRSNEELEQFAYVASHDLKAPLRGIDNLVTWIAEDIGDALTGETRTNMDLLHNRVRRLENLLNDLLQYSRAGRKFEAAETVDTRMLVRELVGLISPPEGFTISEDDSLPTISVSRAPLTQVFQNLIGNAVKHHDDPSRGHIWISARMQPEVVEFIVADDGPGIPDQFLDRVFGMFQTLKPRDEVEGSGMGLAIVKKLVETHGGAVTLQHREGRGLAVHFTWPINPRKATG
jgi:PAS domain S-box-containing protein